MPSRRTLAALVFALPSLAFAAAVVLGAALAADGLADAVAGRILRGVGIGFLVLLAVDLLLLAMILGLKALAESPRDDS